MHRHVWKITSTEERESPMVNAGVTSMKGGNIAFLPMLLARKLIVTFECEICGTQKVEVKSL